MTEMQELEVRQDWVDRKLQAISRSAVGLAGSLTQQSLLRERAEIRAKIDNLNKPKLAEVKHGK